MNGSLRRQPTFLDVTTGHAWFSREMRPEGREQKSHTYDAALPRSGWCFLLVAANFQPIRQKHFRYLGKDASSKWNLCSFLLTPFCGKTSGVIEKRLPFSQIILKEDVKENVTNIHARLSPFRIENV